MQFSNVPKLDVNNLIPRLLNELMSAIFRSY